MAADVINLRQARKQKARAEKDVKAAENRAQFGRSRHEKAVTRALRAQVEKALDQGKLEKSPTAEE
jgi:predicted secreted protein